MYLRSFKQLARKAAPLVLAVALGALLTGCHTTWESRGPRKSIAIGMSTETVKERFGPPAQVDAGGGDGGQRWQYRVAGQDVTLVFDEYGTLSEIDNLPGLYIKTN